MQWAPEENLTLVAAHSQLALHTEDRGPGQRPRIVGAVGIEVASLIQKSFIANSVAPTPHSNWGHLVTNSELSAAR
jgi:hypothetical protein